MKWYPDGIGALGIVLVVVLLLSANTDQPDSASFNRSYWEEQVRVQGAERAYGTFKRQHATTPRGMRHLAAHAFGEALYAGAGTRGLAVCDTTFEFGCYHGLITAAIAEGGEARVRELDRACLDAFGELGGGCLHGIGHGILEYVGYARLDEALTMCDRATTQVAPLIGCTSGVFMEYFGPLVEGEDGGLVRRAREVETANPYAPCTSVAPSFLDSCYYEFGQHLFYADVDRKRLCAQLAQPARAYCFMGLGKESVGLVPSLEDGKRFCKPFVGLDGQSCRAGVAWRLFAEELDHEQVIAACEGDAECLTRADLTRGRDRNFPRP